MNAYWHQVIRLGEDYEAARAAATERDITLDSWIRDALRSYLLRSYPDAVLSRQPADVVLRRINPRCSGSGDGRCYVRVPAAWLPVLDRAAEPVDGSRPAVLRAAVSAALRGAPRPCA